MITTKQLISKYGKPTITGVEYLTTLTLPYPMKLSWDLKTKVTKIRCHKLVVNNFRLVFEDILIEYGYDKIQELEIDLFGGCFNYRRMRSGNDWSRHSWGVAIDLSPLKNGMNTSVEKSQFIKEEYKPMRKIFKNHGFLWGGDLWKKDCMHWEIKA